MNDISRAMEKKRAEKAKHRYEVGAESGADWRLRKYVTDHVAASVIVTLHSLRHDFNWGAKRLQDLQRYIHDNIDAVLKSQVPIWEFMKCLNVECNIDYPALEAYEKQNGPVDIYHGNRGER